MTMDEAVLASIKLSRYDDGRGCYDCGCQQRGELWFLCQYHEGFGDGYDKAIESAAALAAAVEGEPRDG